LSKLWKELRRKRVKEDLVKRVEKIYEDTVVMIRTRQELTTTRSFRTTKGVHQGCVMSPLLFNMYMAELKERLERRGIGGVGIGSQRIWNLAYADDIILIAKNRDAMLDMMTLKVFLKDRSTELNMKKSKILVFNNRDKDRKKKWEWN